MSDKHVEIISNYNAWTGNLNDLLESTKVYLDLLKQQKMKGENVDEELENFRNLCHSISMDFNAAKWKAHDIRTGNDWDLA